MTNLPLAVFLAPYALFVLAYSFFFFFNIFHLKEFGIESASTTLLIFAYVGCTVLIIGFSVILLSQFDWSTALDLSALTKGVTTSTFPTNL